MYRQEQAGRDIKHLYTQEMIDELIKDGCTCYVWYYHTNYKTITDYLSVKESLLTIIKTNPIKWCSENLQSDDESKRQLAELILNDEIEL